MRVRIEATIELLLGMVDQLVQDLDRLDAITEDLEPELGAPERHPEAGFGADWHPATWHTQELWAQGIDRDEEHDGRELEEGH